MEFNLADVIDSIAAVLPDREAIIFRDRRVTYGALRERTNRLANHLVEQGVRVPSEREGLSGWETGQDHIGLYLHNGNEYLEGMVAGYKARMAPFNVNYRYVDEELIYLLNDAQTKAIIFHSAFAPRLSAVRRQITSLDTLIQVPDESGSDLLDGACWYEDALAGASASEPTAARSPDDLYILYTGGTTGMPKGVLWRQADIFPAALGGRQLGSAAEWADFEQLVDNARNGGARLMPTAPFMHGAAHWMAWNAFSGGNTVVIPHTVKGLDAADVWATVDREAVNVMLIVGDAFGRPLLDELDRVSYDLKSMLMLVSGGAALSAGVKHRFLAKLPGMGIMDGLGASETGQQASQISGAGAQAASGTFTPGPGMCIVSEDMSRVVPAGEPELGWLAQCGRVPLGYLHDQAKTEKTFPTIDGVRYSVPGDRARIGANGLVELHGRDSVTINSGGEKIFAEEVEAALAHHPMVYDVVVAPRPSERWGSEVVAIVQLRGADSLDREALVAGLMAECEKHIARYKLPKDFRFVDKIARSPAGKADYRWARDQAVRASSTLDSAVSFALDPLVESP